MPKDQPQQQDDHLKVQNSGSLTLISNNNRGNLSQQEDEEKSESALSTFQAKEEEIERKTMEVRDKVRSQLGRVEEETKRLASIRQELEGLGDPNRKEVAKIRKKVDTIYKELNSLGLACQKKEKEHKEAAEAFNEKNKEKEQLITKLMKLVTESERLRMNKLEELSKNVDTSC